MHMDPALVRYASTSPLYPREASTYQYGGIVGHAKALEAQEEDVDEM